MSAIPAPTPATPIDTSQVPSVFTWKNVSSAAVGVTLTVAFVVLPIFVAMPPVAVIIGGTLAGGLVTYALLSLARRTWKKWQINDLVKLQQTCFADKDLVQQFRTNHATFDQSKAEALEKKYKAISEKNFNEPFYTAAITVQYNFVGAKCRFGNPAAYTEDYLSNAETNLNTLAKEIGEKAESLIKELREAKDLFRW